MTKSPHRCDTGLALYFPGLILRFLRLLYKNKKGRFLQAWKSLVVNSELKKNHICHFLLMIIESRNTAQSLLWGLQLLFTSQQEFQFSWRKPEHFCNIHYTFNPCMAFERSTANWLGGSENGSGLTVLPRSCLLLSILDYWCPSGSLIVITSQKWRIK